MAVKLADTLQAMNADFPVAMASGINIVKEDNTEKDLQQMYEDGELGGESMPMPLSANMLLVSENDETSGDLIWSQIDKSEVGSVPLICTEEEWEELDPKPVEGTEVIITDDEIDSDEIGTNIATITTNGVCVENRCVKIGKCVFFNIYSNEGYSFTGSSWNNNVATFPIGFRPNKALRFNSMINREANKFGDFEINTDGTCRLYASESTLNQALIVSGMFFID